MNAARHPPAGRSRVLLNFVVFQLGWFVCVLGAARGSSLAAVAYALFAAALALWLGRRPRRVLLMLVVCAGLGLLVDGLLIGAGCIRFPADPPGLLGVPWWIAGIWLLFATTFDGCLAWLAARPGLAFVLGALGSPLSYASAERLGALELDASWPSVLAVGLGWGALMASLPRLARRLLQSREAGGAADGRTPRDGSPREGASPDDTARAAQAAPYSAR